MASPLKTLYQDITRFMDDIESFLCAKSSFDALYNIQLDPSRPEARYLEVGIRPD